MKPTQTAKKIQPQQAPRGSQEIAVRPAQEVEVIDDNDSVPVPMPDADALTRADVDMQIATARRYPRDPAKSIRAALKLATYNEEIAEGCFYVLKRAGKRIEGPSIRLAEIIGSCWGNLRYGCEVVEEGQRFLKSRGFCWDLESNTAFAGAVQRRITKSDGTRYDDDMIGVTGNAANSIAARNAINRVVPRVYTEMILREVKKVAIGDASTFASKRDRVIERYGKMGVSVDQVLASVGRESVEAITIEDLELLIGVGTAIKEGSTTLDVVFPTNGDGTAPAPTKGTAGLKSILSHAHAKKQEPASASAQKAADVPHDPATGEVKEDPPQNTERVDPTAAAPAQTEAK